MHLQILVKHRHHTGWEVPSNTTTYLEESYTFSSAVVSVPISKENPEIIQISADKDIVFPIKNSNPNYVIKGATHLFPVTKAKEVSAILEKEFGEL